MFNLSDESVVLRLLYAEGSCSADLALHLLAGVIISDGLSTCPCIVNYISIHICIYIYIRMYVCMHVCMYVFIKLHITTQSGPVILVILCHIHIMYVFIKLHITTQSGPVILVILCHSH